MCTSHRISPDSHVGTPCTQMYMSTNISTFFVRDVWNYFKMVIASPRNSSPAPSRMSCLVTLTATLFPFHTPVTRYCMEKYPMNNVMCYILMQCEVGTRISTHSLGENSNGCTLRGLLQHIPDFNGIGACL